MKVASTKDAQIVALLGRITFTETFEECFSDRQDLLEYFDRTFSVSKIEKSIDNQNNFFWIAYVDDLPVGYAKLKLDSQTKFVSSQRICQLQKIYVLKDYLSMKVGLLLQKTVLKKAKELDFEVIWLSVLNSNERAINFYVNNEFVDVGAHDFQIGKKQLDFTVMMKNIY